MRSGSKDVERIFHSMTSRPGGERRSFCESLDVRDIGVCVQIYSFRSTRQEKNRQIREMEKSQVQGVWPSEEKEKERRKNPAASRTSCLLSPNGVAGGRRQSIGGSKGGQQLMMADVIEERGNSKGCDWERKQVILIPTNDWNYLLELSGPMTTKSVAASEWTSIGGWSPGM